MAHRLIFDDSFSDIKKLLSKEEVRDIIDMFYRFGDTTFRLTCQSESYRKGTGTCGSHHYNGILREHQIYLSPTDIKSVWEAGERAIGGNVPAPTMKMAAVMVLVHELQHANQIITHKGHDSAMHRRIPFERYRMRACERDARAYVDDNLEQIAAFCGVQLKKNMRVPDMDQNDQDVQSELQEIVSAFEELDEVQIRDIGEELRSIGLNNAKNIAAVKAMLKERGIKVTC